LHLKKIESSEIIQNMMNGIVDNESYFDAKNIFELKFNIYEAMKSRSNINLDERKTKCSRAEDKVL